jgi:heme-degrading monooxygenase HmoA
LRDRGNFASRRVEAPSHRWHCGAGIAPRCRTTYHDGSRAGWTTVKDPSWYEREAWRFDRRWETDVLTVITETIVKPGREADWEVAYRERAAAARDQDGWVELQLLVPLEDRRRRVVVGTWRDRGAWEEWHTTDTFQETRERLDDATESHGDDRWFEVATEERT